MPSKTGTHSWLIWTNLGENCDKQGSAAGASSRFMIFAGFGDNKTSAGACCPADENRQIQGEK
jgi:hypothetical protein